MGGRVMRRPSDVPPGEWGTGIIFWSKVTKVAENRDGEEEEKDMFFMRFYSSLSPESWEDTQSSIVPGWDRPSGNV